MRPGDSITRLLLILAGAGFPLAAKKFKGLRIPPRVFFFCKHFGTGVLIATAFVHVSAICDQESDTLLLKVGSYFLQLFNLSTIHVFPICSQTSIRQCQVS